MREQLYRTLLKDPRDAVFLQLMLKVSVLLPIAGALYAAQGSWRWLLGALYCALMLHWFGPFILMGHQMVHLPGTFRPKYRWLSAYRECVLGPLFGLTPFTYAGHHIGMHHPENNLRDDLSSTLRYQRDSFVHFLSYWGLFFTLGAPRLFWYLRNTKKFKLLWRSVLGEVFYFAALGVLAWWKPFATIVVFVIPLAAARFLMLAGNWAQHAFIDPKDPSDPLLNSITCIDTRYNDRCFNDGYHALHHVKPAMHWRDLPGAFAATRETYSARGAVVVRGLDHFQVWLFLMLKQHRRLAAHLVMPAFDSEAEALRFLSERLRPVRV